MHAAMPRDVSQTALGTAYLRAAHQLLDAEPRILNDPIAPRLLGEDAPRRIAEAAEWYRTPEACELRSHVVLRSRYCEDRLALAVQRGVSQYIILGAGFDTFVFRQPSWAAALRIVEVDHPGTQERKRLYMTRAGLAMPKNAGFAQVDFEHESLADGLSRHDISTDKLTFFSWLGVTMYLNESAIDAALSCMARFPQGSEVVLTFRGPVPREIDVSMRARAELARRVASLGEPFVSFFDPEQLNAKLLSAGFRTVNFLRPEEAEAQYFRGRPRDIPAPRGTRIASAIR